MRDFWGYAGWVAAGGLLVLLLKSLILKWAGKAIEWLVRVLFVRMAVGGLLFRRALAGYRRKLANLHARLPNPFLENQYLAVRDVYVPLTASSVDGSASVDAYAAIREAGRSVILGAPGAGKSTLLKHSILTWAEADRDAVARQPIPVIVDLHRCNDSTDDIEAQLFAQLDRNGFPPGNRFVKRALERGQISVFLDGFDEVASAHRSRVARQIRDFTEKYDRAQIVVTCRTAVYDGQLAAIEPAIFQINELDDRLIGRFLNSWPDLHGTDHAKWLMTALRGAPGVFQLARNPLMLTMIAFLYGDIRHGRPVRQLPHHRLQFYQEVAEELLNRRKGSLNQFPWQVKKKALQVLALAALDARGGDVDRLSLPYSSVVKVIGDELTEMNLDASAAPAMLTEIEERSGLLIAVDGGERYQFAHLSLQEYFGAIELAGDVDGLLRRHRTDPTRWRETVKLWCGDPHTDSTELIRAVRNTDPVLAFECLTDASRVDEELARELVDATGQMLERAADDPQHPVVAAFGVVAADRRPRGREIFEFLTERARSDPSRTAAAAVHALAATNLPEAVQVIGDLTGTVPAASQALVRLGDLAVPTLLGSAVRGEVTAVDALRAVGTPDAAAALSSLVWRDGAVACRAAWHLAAMLRHPDVEATLRSSAAEPAPLDPVEGLGPLDGETGDWLWVWEPWRSGPSDRLPPLAARIAQLLAAEEAADQLPPDGTGALDSRILLPVCVVANQREGLAFDVKLPREVYEGGGRVLTRTDSFYARRWRQAEQRTVPSYMLDSVLRARNPEVADDQEVVRHWAVRQATSRNVVAMVESAEPELRIALSREVVHPTPGRDDRENWRDVLAPAEPYFVETSWVFYGVLAVLLVLSALGVGRGVATLTDYWPWGSDGLAWATVVLVPVFWLSFIFSDETDPEDLLSALPMGWGFGLVSILDGVDARDYVTGVGLLFGWPAVPACVTYGLAMTAGVTGWPIAIGLLAGLGFVMYRAWRGAKLRERRYRNPLRGLLELAATARDRTSILADLSPTR